MDVDISESVPALGGPCDSYIFLPFGPFLRGNGDVREESYNLLGIAVSNVHVTTR